MTDKNTLIIIVGPTAIGKTALAIKIAKYFNAEIISCDSRQFFKEMSIGTAVPSSEELALIKHHFIQNKSILQPYSVGDFRQEALQLLDNLFQKNKVQVMVGGSGLYVNTILNGLDNFPEVSETVKTEVRSQFKVQGLSYLQKKLQELDQTYYKYLEDTNPQTLKNPQRLTRFVEVSLSSGNPYSYYLKREKKQQEFNIILVGLQADRAVLFDRINLRVETMIASGLIEEVKSLNEFRNLNALQTVGYKEIFEYLDGESARNEAVEKIKINTRRFAKRQITWFKKNDHIFWFDYQEETKNITQFIEEKMRSKSENQNTQLRF